MAQDPVVFPGKRMAGHIGGNVQPTQNLVRGSGRRAPALLVKGAVPGAKRRRRRPRPAVKA